MIVVLDPLRVQGMKVDSLSDLRLTTQDTRIVDLMARVEVYAVKKRAGLPSASAPLPAARDLPRETLRPEAQASRVTSQPSSPAPQSANATNDTEATILQALVGGPKTSNQIRDIIGMTREHTGRLMKALFTRGLVVRNDQNKPYVYEVTEAGRRYLANSA